MFKSPWFFLLIAGTLEVVWAITMKYSDGFTRLIPSFITFFALALSMLFLARASQNLPIGTAYSIWVGIGAIGATVLGIILFQEPVSLARIFFLSMLVISLVGLKVSSSS